MRQLILQMGISMDGMVAAPNVRLVDEYRLTVHPAAFGAGMPIFDGLERPLHLELVESNVFRNGVSGNVYRPRAALAQDGE